MGKKSTKGEDYADRLVNLSGARWKQVLDVQRPYRWNIRRLELGKTLDVGCGIGRHLDHLPAGSVGVDHNKHAIELAKQNTGKQAFTVDDFMKKKPYKKNYFDSMLLAHVLEHVTTPQGKKILEDYLPYVRSRVVVICPQEKGFPTDETHINFLTHKNIEEILESVGLNVVRSYSFPFHKLAGKVFVHNETVVVAEKN